MLRIGLIQTAVTGDLGVNLDRTVRLTTSALEQGASVICLQELFRTPYFPREERGKTESYAEPVPGPTTRVFSELASRHRAVIIVPLFERAGSGSCYNSAVVIGPDGSLYPPYRKIHVPFDPYFYEKNYFRPGDAYRVYPTPFGQIAVLICYDQWFPEAARAATLLGADLIFFPTAIGRIRGEEPVEGDWKEAWETVQRGHAIANGVHIAAVNRVGEEGELRFWGGSFVCDAFGNILARAGDGEEVLLVDLDLEMNRRVREGWGFLANRRPDTNSILCEDGRFGARSVRSRPGTPRKLGYHMPAEWEGQEAVWLAWPHDRRTFPDLEAVENTYAEIIQALHQEEIIHLLVKDQDLHREVRNRLEGEGVDTARLAFHTLEYADVWIRDYGPTFVMNPDSLELGMVAWRFNAWGGKYTDLLKDDRVTDQLRDLLPISRFEPGLVMEGGSFDVNGRGTLITTEQCLLHPNRNPHLSRGEIERTLEEYLGIQRVVWLSGGIAGDDTDGHVDDIARWVSPTAVLCALEEDETDPNYPVLRENYRILRGATDQDGDPLTVVPLILPHPREGEEGRLPASYLNFFIGNRTVLVPVFGEERDRAAIQVIGEAFPDRRVVGIDCTHLVEGLGALHCITQQQPAP